jgi:hypothetical protein
LVRRLFVVAIAAALSADMSASAPAVKGPGTSPAVDADWRAFASRWDGARTVDARAAGAEGDARVADNCTATAGSPVVTCTTDWFSSADLGKVVAVYGAGDAWRKTTRPLTSHIVRVGSTRSIVLAEPARSSGRSPRVVWGTDDTAALQQAVDSLAARSINNGPGGVLSIPAGHYLVRELSLPCARIGTFSQGTCDASYNRIWIRGAGRAQTLLENWDVDTDAPGLLSLGRRAEPAEVEPANARLRQIAISGVSLRQIAYASRPANTIWSYATEDVWIVDTAGAGLSYECYVMGGSIKSVSWRVHYNEMGPCGHGGPAYGNSSSALNLNGADWVASFNLVTGSMQAVEMGSRRGTLTDNVFIAPHRDSIGVNVGSAGSGIWSNTIARNQIRGFISAVEVFNVLGTVNRTSILDNVIVDGVISVNSGMDRNPVREGDEDTVVHGTSIVRGNTLTYTGYLGNTPIKVGTGAYGPQAGLETVHVIGNRVIYSAMHLAGGAKAGHECRVDEAGGRCELSGGFLGVDTFGGGPLRTGPRPMVVVKDNVIKGPVGAESNGRDVSITRTPRELVRIDRLAANYTWRLAEAR